MEEIQHKTYENTTIESYVRFAKDFELIIELSERHGYRLSELGLHILDLKRRGISDEIFKSALANVLLNSSRKGHIVKRFLVFARAAPSRQDVWKEFNRPTGKVLVNWCLIAGLVREQEGYVATVSMASAEDDEEYSNTQFWDVLSQTFAQMSIRSTPGMKRLYAKIREIRPKVTVKLGLKKGTKEFDRYLDKLLLDNRYKRRVSLYGAPSNELEDDRNVLVHDGKRYAYISIRRGSE